jgi:hypothetical protein
MPAPPARRLGLLFSGHPEFFSSSCAMWPSVTKRNRTEHPVHPPHGLSFPSYTARRLRVGFDRSAGTGLVRLAEIGVTGTVHRVAKRRIPRRLGLHDNPLSTKSLRLCAQDAGAGINGGEAAHRRRADSSALLLRNPSGQKYPPKYPPTMCQVTGNGRVPSC